jgi:hypothetical protein
MSNCTVHQCAEALLAASLTVSRLRPLVAGVRGVGLVAGGPRGGELGAESESPSSESARGGGGRGGLVGSRIGGGGGGGFAGVVSDSSVVVLVVKVLPLMVMRTLELGGRSPMLTVLV